MFKVCFSHLILSRDGYKKFFGIVDNGFSYVSHKTFKDLDEAQREANIYRNDGHGQFLYGDRYIDVYFADIYDENGDLVYE